MPTPHGPVTVSVTGTTATITSPVPVTYLAPDGSSRELPAGSSPLSLG